MMDKEARTNATQGEKRSRIAVVLASVGRPDELAHISDALTQQTRQPDHVLFVVASEADLPSRDRLYPGADVKFGAKGLPLQRNVGLDHTVDDYDIVVFFDDDYLPSQHALEGIERFFNQQQDVVGITGTLLEDGIKGPGTPLDRAQSLIQAADAGYSPDTTFTRKDVPGLYGCNMAFRASAIGETRFDPRLPLYAWLEDTDFSARVGERGAIVKSNCFIGVHRGVKRGRTSGTRYGYSQIANPIYLIRKGSVGVKFGANLMLRNWCANHLKALRPEPYIDRWGRVRGNWRAIGDILTGRLKPERITEFE